MKKSIMNRIGIICCIGWLCGVCGKTVASESLSAAVKQKFIEMTMKESPEERSYLERLSRIPPETFISDQCVAELHQLFVMNEAELKACLSSLQEDGSWSDINYRDTKRSGWEVKAHAERVLALCKIYHIKRKAGEKTAALVQAIHRSMNYWFERQFRCPNWWYNEIGIPRTFGPAFLLFEQEMSADEKEKAVKVMAQSQFGRTGQNRIWQAGNVLMRALLQADDNLLKEACDVIRAEIVTGEPEGIKPDWSFHQHGPQQQMGNYGLAYLCDMSFYAGLLAHTPLAFQPSETDVLVSFLLNGYQWITWKGHLDVNALNRQLFHNVDVHKIFSLFFAAYNLKQACTQPQGSRIQAFIRRNMSDEGTENDFCGTKHFACSDYTVHRTPRWMASLRMASERVIGVEQVNEDNLQGYYMADGALYTYDHGGEYHNIFPVWNWRMIPGITTYMSCEAVPNPNHIDADNHSIAVGGASYGDTGVSAMQLNRNKLTAHKMWLFTEDAVFCMGGNIRTDSLVRHGLMTCIDQRLCEDEPWTDGASRFWHNGTGYIVLDADTCIMRTEEKSGSWHEVMGMYPADYTERKSIFSLHIEHDSKEARPSSYQYVILPAVTLQQVKDFSADCFKVLQNTGHCQSVMYGDYCYTVVYQPGDVTLPDGRSIQMTRPGIYKTTAAGSVVSFQPFETNLQ